MRELDRKPTSRRFPWETELAPSRFAPGVLRRMYVDSKLRAVAYVSNIIVKKQLEEAHDCDGVLVAASALDQAVECDGVRLLSSALVEVMCRRVSSFEQCTEKSGKGYTAWKANAVKIKKLYAASDVIPSVTSNAVLGRPERQALEQAGW